MSPLKYDMPLDYNAQGLHFHFDSQHFEEHYINGITRLYVKPNSSIRGIQASMPLNKELVKGRKYKIYVRFKTNTTSTLVNFHIKNRRTDDFQVVLNYPVDLNAKGFISAENEFVPNKTGYDAFMIGAFHIRGEDAHIAFEYIRICEVDN